jgi:hypothetical protein
MISSSAASTTIRSPPPTLLRVDVADGVAAVETIAAAVAAVVAMLKGMARDISKAAVEAGVVAAATKEAARTATLSARSVANRATHHTSAGTDTLKMKRRKYKEVQTPPPTVWIPIGTLTPGPQITSPVS